MADSREILEHIGTVPLEWSDDVCDDVLDTLQVVLQDIKNEEIG